MAASSSAVCAFRGPPALSSALLQFQRDGVQFGIRKNGRCLIGDEMGLGKTLQALAIAYHYKEEWPLLIVVPSSVKFSWIEEIEKWLPDIHPQDINLIRSGTDVSNISNTKISLLGYGLLGMTRTSKLLINTLKKQQFKVMIIDESHYLKNRLADRTKNLYPLAKDANRVILLSGTPSLARPEELYVQLDIVKPGLFGSFSKFANEYCEAHMEFLCGGRVRKWNTRGASNLDKLHQILTEHLMIRRLKKDVLTQLPPKRRQKVTFDVSNSDYKKDLDNVMKEFRYHQNLLKSNKESEIFDANMKSSPLFELRKLSSQLYQYTGLVKAAAVQHYITDLLEGMENKFIVFCRHQLVMKAVEETLTKKKALYIRIAGDVPSGVRGELVHRFQADPGTRVALLSIEAASYGITLTAADHVVFAELHYTPGMMMQAEDRAHRIGQENAVNVHYLVARGTVDEMLWGMLCRKLFVTSSALDGKLEEFKADVGDEEKAKEMSICSAWIPEEESEVNVEEEFLFPTKKSKKKDRNQSDLRSFFSTPPQSQADSQGKRHESPCSTVRQRTKVPATAPKGGGERHDILSTDESSDDDVLEISCSFLEQSAKTLQKPPERGGPRESNATDIMSSSDDDIQEAESSPRSALSVQQQSIMLSQGQDLDDSAVDVPNKVEREEEGTVTVIEPLKVASIETIKHQSRESETCCTENPVVQDTVEECSVQKALSSPALSSFLDSSKRGPKIPSPISNPSVNAQNTNCGDSSVNVVSDKSVEVIHRLAAETPPISDNVRTAKAGSHSSSKYPSQSLGKKCLSTGNSQNDVGRSSTESVITATANPALTSSPLIHDFGLDNGQDSDDFQCAKPRRSYARSIVGRDSKKTTGRQSHKKSARNISLSQVKSKTDDTDDGNSITGSSQERINRGMNSKDGCAAETGTSDVCSGQERIHRDMNSQDGGAVETFRRQTPPDWACSACTLLNDWQMIECSICFTPRRRSQRRLSHEFHSASTENKQDVTLKHSLCKKRKKRKRSSEIVYINKDLDKNGFSCQTEIAAVVRNSSTGETIRESLDLRRDNFSSIAQSTCSTKSHDKGEEHNRQEARMESDDSCYPFTNSEAAQEWSSEVTIVGESPDECLSILSKSSNDDDFRSSSACNDLTDDNEKLFVPRKRLKLQVENQGSPVTISEFSCDGEPNLKVNHLRGNDIATTDTNWEDDTQSTTKRKLFISEEVSVATEDDAMVKEILNSSGEWVQEDDDYWKCENCDSYNFDDEPCSNCSSPHPKLKLSECTLQESLGLLNENDLEEMLKESDWELQSSCSSSTATGKSSSVVRAVDKDNYLVELDGRGDQHHTGDNLCKVLRQRVGDLPQPDVECSLRDQSDLSTVAVQLPEDREPPKEMTLQFSMSRYTDRVYLYDEEGEALNINFLLPDVENRNMEDLPKIFSVDFNLRQAMRLVRDWKRLGEGKKRVVRKSGLIFSSVAAAYEFERQNQKEKPSFTRHSTKETMVKRVQDTAVEMGGDVRVVIRPSLDNRRRRSKKSPGNKRTADHLARGEDLCLSRKSVSTSPSASAGTDGRTSVQAFAPDGVPLCLYCLEPVELANLGTAWDARFCSYDCKEEHQVRVSGSSVRRKLYEEEQGVCQLCGLDAHAMFQGVKALPAKERRAFLGTSLYANLPPRLLNKMITEPREGMFWEADHITPVAEGGGECGLANYRTLCVPCHRTVTAELNRRLKKRRMKEAGYADITNFFGP